jgi:hypothetical protein
MLGDFPAYFGLRPLLVMGQQTITTLTTTRNTQVTTVTNMGTTGTTFITTVVNTTTTQTPTTVQVPVKILTNVRVPIATRGAFKIAENESPAPEDRVFFTYNFYSDVTGPAALSQFPETRTIQTVINGNPTTITTRFAGFPSPRLDVHREAFGFEKTLLDGNASIGLRAPFIQQEGVSDFSAEDFGDLTLILKYAFLNDPRTRDVLCAGLGITVPTGPSIPLPDGSIHPALLQPYVGYRWHCCRFYVHGFSSLVVPTDSRDVTLLFNDVGVGYNLCHDPHNRLVTDVIPTVEAHLSTPLNHRNTEDAIFVPDLLVLTAGVHLVLPSRSTLTVGAATPVTGPRPFDVEAMAQLNWRF